MEVTSSGDNAMLAEQPFGLCRCALDAGLGECESARFELVDAGGNVIAYNRSERLVISFAVSSGTQANVAQGFLFVGAALALSHHFGTLVVPAQADVRPWFTYAACGTTVHGYRFAVSAAACVNQAAL